jgi:hypothetical protein
MENVCPFPNRTENRISNKKFQYVKARRRKAGSQVPVAPTTPTRAALNVNVRHKSDAGQDRPYKIDIILPVGVTSASTSDRSSNPWELPNRKCGRDINTTPRKLHTII